METPSVKAVGNLRNTVASVDPVKPRGPVTHRVKSWPQPFRDALVGRKRFEVRRDDRDPGYQTGDVIELLEYEPNLRQLGLDAEWSPILGGTFTGRSAMFVIGYVARGPFLPTGWVGFDLISTEDLNRLSGVPLGAVRK